MELNHMNLVVLNVANAIKLFETYFGFTCIDTKGDNIIAILKGANNFTLVIMADKNEEPNYPEAFHIGFMLDSESEVRDVHGKLKHGGIEVGQEPRKIRDSFGFYFHFDNLMIEVGHYLN